jgi:hypothetical protein
MVFRIRKRYGVVLLSELNILDAHALFNMHPGLPTEPAKITFQNAAVELVGRIASKNYIAYLKPFIKALITMTGAKKSQTKLLYVRRLNVILQPRQLPE